MAEKNHFLVTLRELKEIFIKFVQTIFSPEIQLVPRIKSSSGLFHRKGIFKVELSKFNVSYHPT